LIYCRTGQVGSTAAADAAEKGTHSREENLVLYLVAVV